VGGGQVEIFPGNYEDCLWRKQGGQHVAPTLDDVPGAKHAPEPVSPKTSVSAPVNGNGSGEPILASDAPKKRLNPIKRKQMEDRVHELEEEISRAETAIANLEAALQNFVSAEESQRQSQELDQHKANHAALIQEWEALGEALQASD
jgi:ATP-binding cassette subfamily F protein 3